MYTAINKSDFSLWHSELTPNFRNKINSVSFKDTTRNIRRIQQRMRDKTFNTKLSATHEKCFLKHVGVPLVCLRSLLAFSPQSPVAPFYKQNNERLKKNRNISIVTAVNDFSTLMVDGIW